MKNQFVKNVVCLLALFLFCAGTSLAASYRITIDCNHSSIKDTDTGSRITVSLLRSDGTSIRSVWSDGIRICATRDAVFSINTNEAVRQVRFSTNGNDAYYIDEWRLFRDGRLIKREGRDNGKGWCLSTDVNDTAGWRNYLDGNCRRTLIFPVAGASPPPRGANYRITIDCNHSSIKDTDTGSRITVSLLRSDGTSIRSVWSDGIRICATRDAVFSINTNEAVRHVEFSTNGNDAFYIDEWRLFRNNRLIRHEGQDNGKGWCLSTDSRDSVGWQGYLSGGCRSRIRF